MCSFLTYSFEYQSVVSALVPTLVIMRHANLSLGVINALLEILSSDQLEMEQPQVLQRCLSSAETDNILLFLLFVAKLDTFVNV